MSLQDPNVSNPKAKKRVAIVIANPTVSTTTGWPVGFWWSELTHPYLAFEDAGYEVEIFSPDGSKCTADGMSDPNDDSGYSSSDLISQGFIHTPKLMALVDNTQKVADMSIDRFDAIVVAGGQAPMFSYDKAQALLALARTSDGEYLVKGKTVTGFANVEEDFADNAVWNYGLLPRDKHVMPWRIEDRLKELGGNYVQMGLWRSYAVRDGNLITGQQNFSGTETAKLVIETLGR